MSTVYFKCPETKRLIIKLSRDDNGYGGNKTLWWTDFPLYEAELNLEDKSLRVYSIQNKVFEVKTLDLNKEDVFELSIAVFDLKFMGNNKMTLSHYRGTLKTKISEMDNINMDLLSNAELEEVYCDLVGDYRNIYDMFHGIKYNVEAPCLPFKTGFDDEKYLIEFLKNYEDYFNTDIESNGINNLDEDNIYTSKFNICIDNIAYPHQYAHLIDYHGEEEALEIYTLTDYGHTERSNFQIGYTTEIYGIKKRIHLEDGKVSVESRDFTTTLFSDSGVRFREHILNRDKFRMGLKDNMQEDVYPTDKFLQIVNTNSPFSITDSNTENIIKDYINSRVGTNIQKENTTSKNNIRGF